MGYPDSQDWVRLEVLILRRACALLRKIFRRRWKLSQSTEWLDSAASGQEFVKGLGSQIYKTCGRLHKMTLEEGDVNNWDFTMLTRILREVDFKPEDIALKSEFENENLRIQELLSYKNKAADHPNKTIRDVDFSNYWDQIERILVSFGENEKLLDDLKRSESISEEDLLSLSSDSEDCRPIDQLSISEARRLKDEAKTILNLGKDLDQALTCLTSAIGLHNLSDLELGSLHAARSEVYLRKASMTNIPEDKQEFFYQALKDAKHALFLRPAWGLAYYRVGKAYVELKKFKKASKYLDQALNLEPSMEEILKANKSCKIKLVELGEDFAPNLKTFQRIYPLPGGTRLSPEVRKGMDLIFFSSEEDNVLADIYKAHKFRDGIQTKQSYKDAAMLYRRGAKARNAEGMYNLALLKLEGKGVKQDVKGGMDLLKRAAKQPHQLCKGSGSNFVSNVGVAESEFVLGLLAAEGIGFPPQKDSLSACVWYQEACDHGHALAAHNLAVKVARGQGTVRNLKRALQFWKLGASRKVPESMFALAIQHAKEWETGEARRWLEMGISENASNYNYHDYSSGPLDFNTSNEEDGTGYHNAIWSPEEIAEFRDWLYLIDSWRKGYGQNKIGSWEISAGYPHGKTMNQNLTMKDRLIRMLHGVESEQQKIEQLEDYLISLQPRPIVIPFPNAKAFAKKAREGIYSDIEEHSRNTSPDLNSTGSSIISSISSGSALDERGCSISFSSNDNDDTINSSDCGSNVFSDEIEP